MRTIVILAALTALLAAAAPSSPAGAPTTVTTGASAYGHILLDGHGFALYAFTHDSRGRSTCAGACAKAWPPYLVAGRAVAAGGAKPSLLGTTRRDDGTLQVTYSGRPLYHYVGDRKPGQVLCQGVSQFGGLWLVVRANGKPVR